MKLLFKQRMFSWFDSYDIYDENEATLYTVEGELAWGHLLKIYDAEGREVGMVKQKVLTWLPKFELYEDGEQIGTLYREFSLLKPHYNIDCNGWHIDGDWVEWDYSIAGENGEPIATISKELFHWTDTYTIDVEEPADALRALMVVLAIDAEKCSRS